ncbi:pirin family protein [Microterricola viridarii]|uniref:Pirin n=1 Tax=Microterricola viridarii TaxID=412690 RepID=A0A0Y0NCY7_9MICO|nr:pirin family protein [Microterricola viridarii]AMB57581.1 pirin [Microterricola viridarii]
MSNLERDPAELVCEFIEAVTDAGPTPVEVLQPRDVPLGGPRAMPVRRTLPQRGRSTIGAWCFADHYGPDDVASTGGMVVPPHPHTGLQTASWLFEGEIEHRDSVGSHAMVRPGELNLMTAGRGISHSEVSTPTTTVLHGVQLWIALPDAARSVQPFFERHDARRLQRGAAVAQVFVGALADEPAAGSGPGAAASPTVFSALLGAQLDLPAGAAVTLALDPSFEHGLLVDAGPVALDDGQSGGDTGTTVLAHAELGYLAPGRSSVTLRAGDSPVRLVLLGGEPFPEQIVMWWNFIGRGHDEIVEDRREWQHDVIGGAAAGGRFGTVADYPGSPLPAPALPTVRLKPRG